eukprot:TRINITY_DN1347_c0_g1_i1.p1 TRINITY_DN1347_c0_g1~~TRINITY_DN1347_c0_g1_i1.p1  ORF type:complete len:581 (-),score=129.20 TRINITY_DN1347_c0_g1_i1:20-1762(-)
MDEDFAVDTMQDQNYHEFLKNIKEIEEYGIHHTSPPSTPTDFLIQPQLTEMPPYGVNFASDGNFGFPSISYSTPMKEISQNNGLDSFGISSMPISPMYTHTPESPFELVSSPISTPQSSASVSVEGIQILVQPKKYQIVNYNIYPAPEIELSKQYDQPITIQAFLIYDGTLEIAEGFTHGDVQVMKPRETRLSFPALHLNRMTPIKNAVQQNGMSLGSSFYIKWKIGNLELISTSFKLVSACNQIPKDEDVRPRPKPKSSTEPQPRAIKQFGGKRRAAVEIPPDEEVFFHVKVRGDSTHRGFINVPVNGTLKAAREEILKSNQYPKSFRFWHERVGAIVQFHQEGDVKVEDAADGTCLIIDHYDMSLENIDDQILSLWLSKKDVKEPLVPIVEVIRALFAAYKVETTDIQEFDVINGGIFHFLANVTKSNAQSGMVSIEDFKLFLKFYGPAHECLGRVFNVYREPYFHGFARHTDAVDLLRRSPGSFLVRYSESQLKDGFFAFTVNKGNGYKDVIENYSLKYSAEAGRFLFHHKGYKTLREFTLDPDYKSILQRPLIKTTQETVKQSKYLQDQQIMGANT